MLFRSVLFLSALQPFELAAASASVRKVSAITVH